MANIKIKRHKQIQAAVDNRQGHTLTKFADAHFCAVSYADQQRGSQSALAIDALAEGVEYGVALFQRYLAQVVKFNGKIPLDFGIYLATQETTDGSDHLYFIGTPNQILLKLLSVEKTEECGPDGVLEPGDPVYRLSAGDKKFTYLSRTVGPCWMSQKHCLGLARVSALPNDNEYRKVKINPDQKQSGYTVLLMNIGGQLYEVEA